MGGLKIRTSPHR